MFFFFFMSSVLIEAVRHKIWHIFSLEWIPLKESRTLYSGICCLDIVVRSYIKGKKDRSIQQFKSLFIGDMNHKSLLPKHLKFLPFLHASILLSFSFFFLFLTFYQPSFLSFDMHFLKKIYFVLYPVHLLLYFFFFF